MSMQFKPLFSVSINHAYFNGACKDFTFIITPETRNLLRKGKLLARESDGKLIIYFEADLTGTPKATLPGMRLRFGLKLNTPYFSNYTDLSTFTNTALFQNGSLPNALDAPVFVKLVSDEFSHRVSSLNRPVTVAASTDTGALLDSQTLAVGNSHDSVSFTFRKVANFARGRVNIAEVYSGSTVNSHYFVDTSLNSEKPFGILDIAIDSSMYTSPADFSIDFAAKLQTLKYYVVAKNYAPAHFNQLQIDDLGFTEEARPEILFSKTLAPSFNSNDILPSLLSANSDELILFSSQAPVARQYRGRKKIELHRAGETLFTHLPQPAADKASSDIIVHIAKP